MLLFKVLVKPIIAGGVVLSAAAGGWFVIDRLQGDDLTPFQAVQDDGQRLIVSEFGDTADTIVAVDPADAGERSEIARISHAPGYGVFATLSPDGQSVAYTALPEDEPEPSPDTPAIAGIVEADGSVDVLADDVDLLIAPVWSPDGGAIVVRRNVAAANSAGTFELLLLGLDGSRSVLASRDGTALFPIAFSPAGDRLYVATLDATGSDLSSIDIAAGASEVPIAHLSDGITRDWKLSPDGSTIAFTAAEAGDAPRVLTRVVDVATGAVSDALASAGEDVELSPAWSGDGVLSVATIDPDTGAGAAVEVAADGSTEIAPSSDGVDLPLSYAPDGQSLAVRAVEDAASPDSASYVEVIACGTGTSACEDKRERISDSADVLIVGWLE